MTFLQKWIFCKLYNTFVIKFPYVLPNQQIEAKTPLIIFHIDFSGIKRKTTAIILF